MTTEQAPQRVKVKRDGPRGWHWIAAANFDPAVHVLVDDPSPKTAAQPAAPAAAPSPVDSGAPPHDSAPAPAPAPVKRGPGRPRKHPI